jgi:NADH-quinone oxidoreductase subunit G
MACPGGCISGAGQPINPETNTKQLRANGLYETDKTLQLHASQDNPYLQKCYNETLGDVGGHTAHELLHTHYHSRKRFDDDSFTVMEGGQSGKLQVCVCVGTSCYVRGSQKLLERIMQYVNQDNLADAVDVRATFCFEACDKGPTVRIGQSVIHKCALDDVKREIRKQMAAKPA